MDSGNTGIYLLEKGKKGLIRAIFSRLGLILVLLIIQMLTIVAFFQWFEDSLPQLFGGTILFTAGIVLYLVNSRIDPTAKITWLMVMMLMPAFGALFFFYTKSDLGHRTLGKRIGTLIENTQNLIPQSEDAMEKLRMESPETASLAHYLKKSGCYPVFDHTSVKYFPLGEKKFEEMLIQLEKAKRFIFLEYFIVDEGLMWGKLLEILARKAKQGVEVRVMYDGTCEFSTLPHDYPKRLQALGIQCKMFAPVAPFVSTHYNYRDHRKILVIDGTVAFTGGVNLADEYINHVQRFGHWKDTAIMLQGNAVKSFTLMFLQMWNISEKNPEFETYLHGAEDASCLNETDDLSGLRESEPLSDLTPNKKRASFQNGDEGYVIPYGDNPMDEEKAGELVYMDILNRAQSYVHMMSPYLILDGELETAMKFAAARGVDVKLILPGIPDKISAYSLAKTHYASLMEAGVKIYEYTPGFVHAKVFVSDDCKAVVGTINLDYRSLYHHFECAAYLYGVSCISEIEADFQETLKKCQLVTAETMKKEKWTLRVMGILLKVIAPML